jgi:hypothetical protein
VQGKLLLALYSAHVLDLGVTTACLVRSSVVLQTIKLKKLKKSLLPFNAKNTS